MKKQEKTFIDRDKIMHKDDFYKLPKADRRALMSHWRIIFTTEQIKKEMGISTTAFYALLKRLELPTNLNEWRNNQKSLLGEYSSNDDMGRHNSETTTESPVADKKEYRDSVEISISGQVEISKLSEILDLIRENNLEIFIK